MRINSRQKGKRIELYIVHWLKERGCPSARRTQQYSGTEGTSDITCEELNNWHIECKGVKKRPAPSIYAKWLRQVARDASKGKQAVIICKMNRTPLYVVIPFIQGESTFCLYEAEDWLKSALEFTRGISEETSPSLPDS